jgi:hypothetical protein
MGDLDHWAPIYVLNVDQYDFVKQIVYSTVLKGRKCCIKNSS